jgi:GNAT superfamily N-acetyltransferase
MFRQMGLHNEALEALLLQQFQARQTHYGNAFPEAETTIYEESGTPVGFMILDIGDQIRIVDIALIESHRGRGIGTRVLEGLSLEADALGKEIGLCVDQGSPAMRLYERFGFVAISDENFVIQMVRQPQV